MNVDPKTDKKILIGLSNSSPLPLYDQIEEEIRSRVLRGDLSPGEAVPSFRRLAADLRVSLITVKRAYDDLVAEGVLVARAGRGTFVAEKASDVCRRRARSEFEELVGQIAREARRLGIEDEEFMGLLKNALEEENQK